MDDKELLEKAAKAAGLRLEWQRDILRASDDGCVWEIWNPLVRDGDALRLAVKLGLMVSIENDVYRSLAGRFCEFHVNHADPCAATRRVIVRAAAELGATHD